MAARPQSTRTVTQLVNCLGIGGTERQLIEHLRQLDTARYTPDVCCLLKRGEFLGTLRAMQLDPEEFNLQGTLLQPNTIVQVTRLAKRLRDRQAALLHCHDFYSNLIGSSAALLAGVPFIVSRRDLGVWTGPAQNQALSLVTRLAPRVLCNARAIRDRLVHEEGVAPERVRVIHNGIDLERFDAQSRERLSSPVPALETGDPVVALVGNLKHPVKGHADFLLAAAAVHRAVPRARFLLVGDGALRPEMERRARELGLGEHALFVGRRTDVAALLRRCTVAVCSSHAEGLSNSVMEAMAAGLPVVATSVGGNVELVRDGRTGFLVRRADPTGLAVRLIDILRAPHLARRMGVLSRRRIEDEFSSALLARRMAALYDELLGGMPEVRRAA